MLMLKTKPSQLAKELGLKVVYSNNRLGVVCEIRKNKQVIAQFLETNDEIVEKVTKFLLELKRNGHNEDMESEL